MSMRDRILAAVATAAVISGAIVFGVMGHELTRAKAEAEAAIEAKGAEMSAFCYARKVVLLKHEFDYADMDTKGLLSSLKKIKPDSVLESARAPLAAAIASFEKLDGYAQQVLQADPKLSYDELDDTINAARRTEESAFSALSDYEHAMNRSVSAPLYQSAAEELFNQANIHAQSGQPRVAAYLYDVADKLAQSAAAQYGFNGPQPPPFEAREADVLREKARRALSADLEGLYGKDDWSKQLNVMHSASGRWFFPENHPDSGIEGITDAERLEVVRVVYGVISPMTERLSEAAHRLVDNNEYLIASRFFALASDELLDANVLTVVSKDAIQASELADEKALSYRGLQSLYAARGGIFDSGYLQNRLETIELLNK